MQTTSTTTSKKFSLNLNDWWRGLIMAVISPAIAIALSSLEAGELTFKWKIIAGAALTGLLSYLLKNFFTPSTIVVKAPESTVEAVKEGNAEVTVTKS